MKDTRKWKANEMIEKKRRNYWGKKNYGKKRKKKGENQSTILIKKVTDDFVFI